MIDEKRRSSRNSRWFWGIAAAGVVVWIAASQNDNRPATNTQSRPPSSFDQPASPSVRTVDYTEERPPVGTGLSHSLSNIRYCTYQGIRLEAARGSVTTEEQRSLFNAGIDDLNSRCSNYRYRPSDKNIVDAEVISKKASLENEGRSLAESWRARPPAAASAGPPAFENSTLTIQTSAGARQFVVGLATTPEQWSWGMREPVPANVGMLYIYPAAKTVAHTMRNVPMPLDVLFIDQSGKVIQIVANRPAMLEVPVRSTTPVIAMLEINAGAASRSGIAVGDSVRLAKTGQANATSAPGSSR